MAGQQNRNTRTVRMQPPIANPTTQLVELTSAFIMAPFLQDAIFNKKSTDPLQLIILAQEAANNFDGRHLGAAGFADASAMEHVNAFTNWALAMDLGKLVKAIVTIDPDNNELQNFSAAIHAECILPPLGATGTLGGAKTVSQHGFLETEVIKSLGKGLKQMGEVADKANVLKREEIKLKGEEDKKKKTALRTCTHPSPT
jgi:hypothetical protein